MVLLYFRRQEKSHFELICKKYVLLCKTLEMSSKHDILTAGMAEVSFYAGNVPKQKLRQ